jgi:hypothetical protein
MNRQSQIQQVSDVELELLGAAIEAGQSSFLVRYKGSFRWVIICLDSLARGQLRFYFTMFATTEVPFKAVIFPGTQGAQRSLFVRHPDTGKTVCARYIRFVEETVEGNGKEPLAHFLFEIRVTGEELIIPITQILPEIPSEADKMAFDVEMQKISQMKKLAPCLQFPMALPRNDKNHILYPYLDPIILFVLFQLCQKFEFQLGKNYPFNNLLIRLQACGPQFVHEVPRLTASEQEVFKDFERRYMENLLGNVMESGVQRCSKLTVQQVFLAQLEIAKSMKIQAQCALSLPSKYFIDPEPEVVLRKGPNDFVPHSSLMPLE